MDKLKVPRFEIERMAGPNGQFGGVRIHVGCDDGSVNSVTVTLREADELIHDLRNAGVRSDPYEKRELVAIPDMATHDAYLQDMRQIAFMLLRKQCGFGDDVVPDYGIIDRVADAARAAGVKPLNATDLLADHEAFLRRSAAFGEAAGFFKQELEAATGTVTYGDASEASPYAYGATRVGYGYASEYTNKPHNCG